MDNHSSFKRVLSLKDIILFGLSFMAPATVFATYGIAAITSGGMVVTGYIITLFCVLFSAYSYSCLAKRFPYSGSSFVYVREILGEKAGFLVGWAILLDYILSPMISALIFGLFMNAYFPEIPNAIFIILFLIIISIINIFGVKLAANYNTLISLLQIAFIIIFCIFSINTLSAEKGTHALFSMMPFYDNKVTLNNMLTCVPILFFSFLGFDAITTLAEETHNPEKVMGKAIFSIVLVGGALFVVSAYFMQLLVPDSSILQNPDSAAIEIMHRAGSSLLVSLFMILTILGTTSSAIASGSSAARILYSMGNDGVLPKKGFSYLSPRFRTPVFNIFLVGLIGTSGILMTLTFATHLISFGVIFSLIFINFSVFYRFFIQQRKRLWIKNAFLPLMGCLISVLILCTLGTDALLLGAVWLLVGVVYLFVGSKNQSIDLVDGI